MGLLRAPSEGEKEVNVGRLLLIFTLAVALGVAAVWAALGDNTGVLSASQGLTVYAPGEEGDQPPRREAATAADSANISSIIGEDDRIQITDTTVYPWRAIAYLELYQGGVFVSDCTGTFVGPDVLITAAHCLYDPIFGWTESIAVVPGKNGLLEPYGFEWALNWWVPDAWISTGGSNWDWGVIKLPTEALGNTVGWFTIAILTTGTLSRADFLPAIVGYPGDMPQGTMWGAAEDAFLAVHDFTLDYVIDTTPGQSGSAIFSVNTDEWFLGAVVGIHTGGVVSFNTGQRIDDVLLDDVLLACVIMDCTISYFVEPQATPTPIATLSATPTVTPASMPTPTTTPTPLADNSAKVTVGNAFVAQGATTTVGVIVSAGGGNSVAALTVDISYDASLVSAIGCTPPAVCNPSFGPNTVRLVRAEPAGLGGEVGTITFLARGLVGTSNLSLLIVTCVDITFAALTCWANDGSITIACPPAGCPRPTPTLTPPMPGDVNCDGTVNSVDALQVLRRNAGLIPSLPCAWKADVNLDGSVNSIDALHILRFVAGLIASLPP